MHRFSVRLCLLSLWLAAHATNLHAQASPANRPLFTTSRLTNPPEPPSPYVTERLWPRLKFSSPVDLTSPPSGDRMFVVEQYGKIYSFPLQGDPATADLALDLKMFQPKAGQSYALAFHPRFAENRFCYICYILDGTLPNGSRVSRFKVKDTNPPTIDPSSEVLMLDWLAGGHNGCCLKFGPEGYLYISTGDGSGPSPPDGLDTGQDLDDLLSCILRIDVDHPGKTTPYSIPAGNPFVNTPGARGEIWAYGLRNPWRMSFDPKNGNLWVGDVGWELWELLFRVEKGGNYGWSVMEGRQPARPSAQRGPTPILPPVIDHPHSEAASITGGIPYYGQKLSELQGQYIYGDFETGKIWGLRYEQGAVQQHRELLDTPLKIVSFSETPQGELCILDFAGGGIYTLARNPRKDQPHFFPKKLSETGLFTSTRDQTPATGVIPYSLIAEPWQDGARAQRWVALQGQSAVTLNKDSGNAGSKGPLLFPEQSLFVKTLSLPATHPGTPPRKMETQILHTYQGYSLGYSYRWNEDQSDAELVEPAGREDLVPWPPTQPADKPHNYRWHFHGRAECARCHNPWTSFVIGFVPEQLDLPITVDGKTENQLARFKAWGLIAPDVTSPKPGAWDNPSSTSASLDQRARTYLHLNCAHCHRMSAGGSTNIELNYDFPLDKTRTVGIRPLQGTLGLHQAQIISAGDPYRSVLFYRLGKIGTGHMPHIGPHEVDDAGLRLLHDWIRSVPAHSPPADPKSLTLPEQATLAESAAGAQIRAAEDKLAEELSHPPADPKPLIQKLLTSHRSALRLSYEVAQQKYPPPVRQAIIDTGSAHTDPAIRDLFERFLPDSRRTQRLGTQIIPEKLLTLRGNSQRGADLFRSANHINCRNCHVIGKEGKELGPNLSQIGKKYTKDKILEQILDPSRSIDQQYVPHLVETRQGRVLTGLLVRKTPTEIVLKDSQSAILTIPLAEVEQVIPQNTSLMPQDLLRDLAPQEAADLLEFLAGLK